MSALPSLSCIRHRASKHSGSNEFIRPSKSLASSGTPTVWHSPSVLKKSNRASRVKEALVTRVFDEVAVILLKLPFCRFGWEARCSTRQRDQIIIEIGHTSLYASSSYSEDISRRGGISPCGWMSSLVQRLNRRHAEFTTQKQYFQRLVTNEDIDLMQE